jgi:hypothetical protein
MKQTAVEWFFNELERMEYFIGNDIYKSYKEAKVMEKEQIEIAYNEGGFGAMGDYLDIECGIETNKLYAPDYYNETYNDGK